MKKVGVSANNNLRTGTLVAALGLIDAGVLIGTGASGVWSATVLIASGLALLIIGRFPATPRETALPDSQANALLQHDRILTIVNNLADAVLSTDDQGRIQLYNAASLNLLDTNTSLDGRLIDDFISLRDSENHPFKLLENLRKAPGVVSRDDLAMTLSNETVRLSLIYSPIRSSDQQGGGGFVMILRDITKQKSLEEERDEFISVVSHELRTPITIAEGTLSNTMAMMEHEKIPKSTIETSVKTAHEQVLFLARMVNDLSTLSRAERGIADEPELIDVDAMIHYLYLEYAPQAEAKGLHMNLDLSPHLGKVSASRLYLKELLQNFVTNSIKYTKKGSITVTVLREQDLLSFTVKDTGIGISKSDQTHIYEKFYRSEDYRTRETGGTGLGLYVAAKLAKKLGTRVKMTSRLNHGSTFGFELPTHVEDAKS